MWLCESCNTRSLDTVLSVDVEPGLDSDEARAQIMKCTTCGAGAVAVYEESRRGSLDSEAWRHTGWFVDDAVITRVTERLQRPPRPSSEEIAAHARLGRWFEVS